MIRRLALAALALAVLAGGVLLLARGPAEALTGVPVPASVERPAFDLSDLRVVEATGDPPGWAAHEKRPARLARPPGPVAAVVGGRETDLSGIPGAVLVQSVFSDGDAYGYQQCAGTALADLGPRYVVTAAHCIEEDALRFDVFYGGEGDGATRATMRRLWGFRAYLSPDYDRATLAGDFAVIELVEPMRLAVHEMARLATPSELRALRPGDRVVVAGWGTTKGGDASGVDPSPVLKEADQVIARVSPLSSAVVSPAGAVEGACQGDSGGSLRKWANRRVVTGFLSNVDLVPGLGVCREPGFRQTFTGAGYFRWLTGLEA